VKPNFRFGGLVGEIAIDFKVALTLPVVVVMDEDEGDDVVTLFIAVVVLEEAACDVVVVTAGDEDEQADRAMVKTSTNPIARQEPISCILSTFIVACPLLD
jgi:hypothetical protein